MFDAAINRALAEAEWDGRKLSADTLEVVIDFINSDTPIANVSVLVNRIINFLEETAARSDYLDEVREIAQSQASRLTGSLFARIANENEREDTLSPVSTDSTLTHKSALSFGGDKENRFDAAKNKPTMPRGRARSMSR